MSERIPCPRCHGKQPRGCERCRGYGSVHREINERFSVRKRGESLKLSVFPPHIFEGATGYGLRIGPLYFSWAGRYDGPKSSTVIRVGERMTIVIPRGFHDDQHEYVRMWKAYVTVMAREERS